MKVNQSLLTHYPLSRRIAKKLKKIFKRKSHAKKTKNARKND